MQASAHPVRSVILALAALAWSVPPGFEVLLCRGTPVAVQPGGSGCPAAACCGCCSRGPAARGAGEDPAVSGARDGCGCCLSVPLPAPVGPSVPPASDGGSAVSEALPLEPAAAVRFLEVLPASSTDTPGPWPDGGLPAASFPLPLRI